MQSAKAILYQARTREDEPAVAMTTGVATYGVLARAVETAVGKIEQLQLRNHAIAVLEVKNPFHHTVLLIALALLGVTSASIQSRQHLALTGVVPDLVITDASDFEAGAVKVEVLDESWFAVVLERPVNYQRLLKLTGFSDPDSIIRVMFSSGTTGHPKAVALTLKAADARVLHGSIASGPYSRQIRSMNLMGMSTLAGFAAPFGALSVGGLIAFAPDIGNAVNLIRVFRIEVLTAAVFQLNALVKELAGKPALTTVRSVLTGGSKLPKGVLDGVKSKLSTELSFVYASTEAGTISAARSSTLERFPDTAGYVFPWVELEAVDAAGQPVPPGQDGVLRVRTSELARYLTPTPDPVERFGDDWFYPGDVGRVKDEGLVYITGRSSEIINRGGVIVAPEYIEEAIKLIPGITDAAVFGVPGPDGIEQIWAAVISSTLVDTNAVRVLLAAKMSDRVPDRIVQVETIPRTETGKIRRSELRSLLIPDQLGIRPL